MGFRFRRSVRLMPGVRLNFSRGGVSASVGGPGARVNIGKRGVRGTVGLPGTGLSYSTLLARPPRQQALPGVNEGPAYRAGHAIGRALLVVPALTAMAVVVGLARSPGPAPVASTPPAPVTRHVTSAVVNCRAGPVAGAAVVTKLTPADLLAPGAERSGWTAVTTNGRSCWVSSALIG